MFLWVETEREDGKNWKMIKEIHSKINMNTNLTYKDEISSLKDKMKEFDLLKLQNEDSLDKLQALYEAGIINENFEPANEMS